MAAVEWSEILNWVPRAAQGTREPERQQPDHGAALPGATEDPAQRGARPGERGLGK